MLINVTIRLAQHKKTASMKEAVGGTYMHRSYSY